LIGIGSFVSFARFIALYATIEVAVKGLARRTKARLAIERPAPGILVAGNALRELGTLALMK
jgi:hypothetical protein